MRFKDLTVAFKPQLSSEFDKEVIHCTPDKDLTDILNIATAFPLGTGKKLVVLKDFDKIKDKKKLKSYVGFSSGFYMSDYYS